MQSTQIYWAIGTAFAITALLVPLMLPFLRRLGAGQSIREEGPSSHMSKSGTPTMGGLAIIGAIVAAAIGFGGIGGQMPVMIFVFLSFAAIGFADDYLKVVHKRNLGLTARQKLALQGFVAALGAFWLSRISESGTTVYIPLIRNQVDFGGFYIVFVAFVVVAMVNAVNLTDGLDGLASGVTAIVAVCLTIIGMGTGAFQASVFSASIFGACLGFLIHNRHPAKLFMGDTGSLALGGALAAAAISMNATLILPLAGGVYVAEALSVIIQVYVFKTQNERRFFRMAPLHHHFELGGWSENKIVMVFCLVTTVLCVLAVAIL
ncbi:MAG TPA: phospho-N-acetylmuramoyl-pentapeptide-transferase [Clostridiales bacterium]|nr:phospho-N-acetylmuramoyl-pentapeptide-transferase [Clostridiales bacterium]